MMPLEPIRTLDLFPGERRSLIELLDGLTPDDWAKPTVCAGWNVHDVALHVLWGDISYLSRLRDGFTGLHGPPEGDLSDPEVLLTFINAINETWVTGARRVSPRLVIDFLRLTIDQITAVRQSLDLDAVGGVVSWAGPARAPVWMDVAREYTERWHHQQHIRDAVAKPGLMEREWCHPVLDAFARALPFALHLEHPAEGTTVALEITGEAGDIWIAARRDGTWRRGGGTPEEAAGATSRVTLDQDTAWRLFTRGLAPEKAAEHVAISGDPTLACRVLRMVTIIA